ncbi:heterokaryon incompatibility protein-domain-containing protein [Apiosordaria backusii]|uniref:Heterokaryon incompatibility protein-domain-containing protein n=1 Tax=Apiosordaria backusii TaxID=314023 RepID=A0AA40EHW6_9PEZI|nr:heterokaryon incompatibility protein-domain-containing protein [Apiosordaria backusii]
MDQRRDPRRLKLERIEDRFQNLDERARDEKASEKGPSKTQELENGNPTGTPEGKNSDAPESLSEPSADGAVESEQFKRLGLGPSHTASIEERQLERERLEKQKQATDQDNEYRENPMNDENRELIDVWMQTEDEARAEEEDNVMSRDNYEAKFAEEVRLHNEYNHHYFDEQWLLYSKDKAQDRKDEDWFIPSPTMLEESDPQYLCDMCRHIDFTVLFTHRGLKPQGNKDPATACIELWGLSRVLNEKSTCSFCNLIRGAMEQQCTAEELGKARETKAGKIWIEILDDGPDWALRLEIGCSHLATRVVVQRLASDDEHLPLQGLTVHQDAADTERLCRWIRTCEDKHPKVARSIHNFPSGMTTLRVIDVEEGCLVMVPTPCRYACLSYVWGKNASNHVHLTSKTQAVLETPGIFTNGSITISKTYLDAIEVTRKIGLRYLWVDALCIMQDDDADKATIISQMGAVYGNAVINIIASTNFSPADGLPGVGTTPRTHCQVVKQLQGLSLAASFHDSRQPYHEIEDAVWNSRAWTFQERHLSQRAVYFTSSQMHFTCAHGAASEDTVPLSTCDLKPTVPIDQPRFEALIHELMFYIWDHPTQTEFPNKRFKLGGLGSESQTMMTSLTEVPTPTYRATPVAGYRSGTLAMEGETLWKTYRDAVNMYTKREMTWQSDAINAFQGVTDLISQRVNTAFWYGMPEFAFDQALLWYPREPLIRRTHPGASPTWSWAGWKGHTTYRGRGWHNAITVVPFNAVRWLTDDDNLATIEQYLTDRGESVELVASFVRQATEEPGFLHYSIHGFLYHLDGFSDNWTDERDISRNEHFYSHTAYPGLRFTYPINLPSQPLLPRHTADGTLHFTARTVPARFTDMSATTPKSMPIEDQFLQIGRNDAAKSSQGSRRPWEYIIYHQGYRAGFLSLNIPCSSVEPASTSYTLVAMSRDTIPQIAPPACGWDIYWALTAREMQATLFLDQEWGRPQTRKKWTVYIDAPPSSRIVREDGDPHWDQGRYGDPKFMDVYNVLLLETKLGENGERWQERVGVGKMFAGAFWMARPDVERVALR